jgi:hypothetical protein
MPSQSGRLLPGVSLSEHGEDGPLNLAPDPDRRRIGPLDEVDERRLRKQRSNIDTLARRHIGMPLSGGKLEDLRILQDLLDQRVFKPDDTYELQSLGAVLGDVMVEQLDFEWVIVEDALGRSRALRVGNTDTLVFPITMISRRYAKDIRFTVEELYEKAATIAASGGSLPL